MKKKIKREKCNFCHDEVAVSDWELEFSKPDTDDRVKVKVEKVCDFCWSKMRKELGAG